ncbi:MAG: hypothetical protein M3454_01560 [Actinomycetota bacterium]|nr:hypothetical protein [Actinomycetota bacterium]
MTEVNRITRSELQAKLDQGSEIVVMVAEWWCGEHIEHPATTRQSCLPG